ncbi:MAG: SDR family NAD(P)-dependent oxidoreductase [Propionicimonas sp.]
MSVVLITGASSGIGRAVAHRLARRGHRLVLASRSAEALSVVLAECLAVGAVADHILMSTVDVRETTEVDQLIEAAVARHGRIDAVVHSAGALAYGRFIDLPAEVFDATLATNLGGSSHVARAALRRFERQGAGHLIMVGSVLGEIAAPTMSAYVTSKWALHGLVRCLQLEMRDTPGVNVSLVSPGGVDTPIYRQAGTYTGKHGAPPPPVATADEVAAVIERTLDHPRREVPVFGLNRLIVLGSRMLPGLFDALVGPLFDRFARDMHSGVSASPGNLFQPRPEGESVSGGYGRWGRHSKEGHTMAGEPRAAGHGSDPGPTISRSVAAPVEAVWTVLADGWSYANWVVGAARVRDVDPGWPAVGSRVHHSFGLWPLLIQDFTRVETSIPQRELELTARGWPAGEAHVHLSVRPEGTEGSVVTITEDAVSGPGRLIPAPVRHLLIGPRNAETLHRLALLAEGHHRAAARLR